MVSCGPAIDDTLPMGRGEQDTLVNPWHAKGWEILKQGAARRGAPSRDL